MPDLLRVLLLEDNPGDARLLREYFAEDVNFPAQVTCVEQLAQALRQLTKQSFAVVLADLNVPDSRGLNTFLKLHEHVPDMPIVVLTGFDDESLAIEALQKGAQDYLVKGQVNSALLVRSLRYAIERQRIECQLARYAEEMRQRNAELQSDLELAR